MLYQKLFDQIQQHLPSVTNRDSELGEQLWQELINTHPADIEQFLANLDREDFRDLFLTFDHVLQLEIFNYMSDSMKATCLSFLSDQEKAIILEKSSIADLADLFDHLSDKELKDLFKLLRTKDRMRVLELMKFGPESAGGIMDTDVITLTEDLTVEKSIQLLQRLQPRKELHQEIYVTDKTNKLVGHIRLEDLVLKHPKTPISTFLQENELAALADEDQETIAQKMVHYHVTNVPVVDKENHFLGVIPSDTLIDIIEEEASEDVYRISAMTPIKQTYFETSFKRLIGERSFILIILLLAESIASTIYDSFEGMLGGLGLAAFITMLVSCGGNTSSQTSALAIQGLSSGEINYSNIRRFLRRELLISLSLAGILGIIAFIRVYFTRYSIVTSIAVALSLSSIVMLSVTLGSLIPIMLKRLNIDPAFSAGPFLATLMDILGILIYCYVSKLILA